MTETHFLSPLDESILVLIEEAGGRGMTCHELARDLGKHPRSIGRSLSRLRNNLDHLRSERDGQKVIVRKCADWN